MNPDARPLFRLKLVIAYIIAIGWIPAIQEALNFGTIQNSTADHNWVLGWSLILCVPHLIVFGLLFWNSKQMPVFSSIGLLLAGWHIVSTLVSYFHNGFDRRMPLDLHPLAFLIAMLAVSIPFALIYLIRAGRPS